MDESYFAEVARSRVCPREGQYGIQVPLGAWHSVVVLEASTIFEAKDGGMLRGSDIGAFAHRKNRIVSDIVLFGCVFYCTTHNMEG